MKTSTILLIALSLGLLAACSGDGGGGPSGVNTPCAYNPAISASDPRCVKETITKVRLLRPDEAQGGKAPSTASYSVGDTLPLFACPNGHILYAFGQPLGWQRAEGAAGQPIPAVGRLVWTTSDMTRATVYPDPPAPIFQDILNLVLVTPRLPGTTRLSAFVDGVELFSVVLNLRPLTGSGC